MDLPFNALLNFQGFRSSRQCILIEPGYIAIVRKGGILIDLRNNTQPTFSEIRPVTFKGKSRYLESWAEWIDVHVNSCVFFLKNQALLWKNNYKINTQSITHRWPQLFPIFLAIKAYHVEKKRSVYRLSTIRTNFLLHLNWRGAG